MERNTHKQIQIDQDRLDADLIKAKHWEDKEMNRLQKIDAAAHFKEIWNAQKELQKQTVAVDKAF